MEELGFIPERDTVIWMTVLLFSLLPVILTPVPGRLKTDMTYFINHYSG